MTQRGFKFLKILSWMTVVICLLLGVFGLAFFLTDNSTAHLTAAKISSVILGLALLNFIALSKSINWPKTITLIFYLSLFICIALSCTVAIGLPFGYLRFTPIFGGQMLGLIPWVMIWYWLPIILTCYVLAHYLIKNGMHILVATCLMLCLSLVSEPAAVSLGLWEWRTTGMYYTVPWLNFVGWGILSAISGLLMWIFTKKQPADKKIQLFFHTYFLLITGFWTAVNTWQQLWFPAAIGLILLIWILIQTISLQIRAQT